MDDPKRQLLRHTVATLAYRGGKTVKGAPSGFHGFQAAPGTRTPEKILAHVGDLLDWALSMAKGQQAWHNSEPLPWDQEVHRFFNGLQAFDAFLGSDAPLNVPAEKIFQGPVADAPSLPRCRSPASRRSRRDAADEVVGERLDDRRERHAEDERHGELDEVAAEDEVLESLEHGASVHTHLDQTLGFLRTRP